MEEVDKGGRPSKFTPERRAAILDSISMRIPYSLAAQANGIGERTLFDWLKQGEKDNNEGIDSEFARFSQSIKNIEQQRIADHLKKIDANVERWQGDAWILERRWYKYFGANVHLHELENRMKQVEEMTDEGKE